MPIPTYLVEIQFGSSAYIDVSQYVLAVNMDRGVDRVLSDYSAGMITIEFNNNARIFDPTNTSSPLWYGAGGYTVVQPGGKIRVTANTSYRRFTGFITNWEFGFAEAGLDATATLTAYDEIYRLGQINFTGGTAIAAQSTTDRMATVMAAQGVASSEYAGIEGGQTLVGLDPYPAGQTILSYLQQLARSEPGDFFSNSSAVMVFKDRSFTPYKWVNNMRINYVAYPSTAFAQGVPYTYDPNVVWLLRGGAVPAITMPSQFGGTVYRGGTVGAPLPADQYVGFEFIDSTNNLPSQFNKYSSLTNKFVFSAYLRGVAGTYTGIMTVYTIQTSNGQGVTFQDFPSVTSALASDWVRIQGTVTVPSGYVPYGVDLSAGIFGSTAYTVYGEGFMIENATAVGSYFDGNWNPGVESATSRNRVAWSGTAFASTSGYVQSTATAVNLNVITFADNYSQGASYGNGTALPFTDLQIVYSSDLLSNRVQVIGTNATATVDDTVGQSRYGLRVYTQYDNLTTSTTRPADIAAGLLAEFRLPEYRAQQITLPLHAYTTAQQNIALNIELRDVIRLIFQPSGSGAFIDKYYQVLGISENANPATDELILKLGSLDNFPIRLDSTILSILDTDTLG